MYTGRYRETGITLEVAGMTDKSDEKMDDLDDMTVMIYLNGVAGAKKCNSINNTVASKSRDGASKPQQVHRSSAQDVKML